MSDELTLAELLEAQAYFRLPSPALVEKDYHVVRALRAIATADTGPLRLVFGGGTALSRAHRLLPRMSEDIDLKIVGAEPIPRQQLRDLRDALTNTFLGAGFEFDPDSDEHRLSRNASRYTLFRLPYPALVVGEAALRPQIQVEVAVWPLRMPPVDLPVRSFVAEAFGRSAEVERISCVSITQTAAEKFVALTRRVAAEVGQGGGPRDATDIRHVYDLHLTRAHYDLSEVAALARKVMEADAALFGHQHTAYRDSPLLQTEAAMRALHEDAEYARRYSVFCQSMVFGERPEYSEAVATVSALAVALR